MKKLLLKLIPLFAALLCTVLLFCACTDGNLAVTIAENGGTLTYEYYVNKKIADEYFNGILPVGLQACEIDEVNGELCYVYSERLTAQSFTELEKKLCDIKLYGEDNMNFFSTASASSRGLTLTVNPFVTDDIKDIAIIQGVNIERLTRLSLNITMPYEIEEYSEGVLSTDKKTLSLKLSGFDTQKNIKVKCVEEPIPEEPSKLPLIISIIGGILLILAAIGAVIALCVFLIKRKNRKRAEAMPDIPIDKL